MDGGQRPRRNGKFWPHPPNGRPTVHRAPDGLFSLAALVRGPLSSPALERLAEPLLTVAVGPEQPVADISREQYETAFRDAGFALEYVPGIQNGRGLFLAVAA